MKPIMLQKGTYFAHLDLLRVLFVFIVLLHHWIAKNPFLFLPFGSTIAFVLSGFLLTMPLLENKKDIPNYWKNTLNFLVRRILRTFPIYLLMFLVYFIVNKHNFRGYSIYYLTFSQNYLIAYNQMVGFAQTWSLAVQEQFYVLIPIVIYLCPYKYLRILFLVFSVAGLAFRLSYFYLNFPPTYNHFATECCVDCFGIGALIAYYHLEYPDELKKILSNKLLLVGLVLLYCLSVSQYSNNSLNITDKSYISLLQNLHQITERTFVSLLSIWFIGWGIYYPTKTLHTISTSSIISYVSKIGYGIYIYHFFAASAVLEASKYLFNFAKEDIQFTWWVICLNFLFTILLSALSYRFIEKPILRLKGRHFGYIRRKKSVSNPVVSP